MFTLFFILSVLSTCTYFCPKQDVHNKVNCGQCLYETSESVENRVNLWIKENNYSKINQIELTRNYLTEKCRMTGQDTSIHSTIWRLMGVSKFGHDRTDKRDYHYQTSSLVWYVCDDRETDKSEMKKLEDPVKSRDYDNLDNIEPDKSAGSTRSAGFTTILLSLLFLRMNGMFL